MAQALRSGVFGDYIDSLSGPKDIAATRGLIGWGNSLWEWSASTFAPYPGFSADRYREYSEPWFDGAHRALRGGSHATIEIMHAPQYRNYFTPQRSDVFAGFRTCSP